MPPSVWPPLHNHIYQKEYFKSFLCLTFSDNLAFVHIWSLLINHPSIDLWSLCPCSFQGISWSGHGIFFLTLFLKASACKQSLEDMTAGTSLVTFVRRHFQDTCKGTFWVFFLIRKPLPTLFKVSCVKLERVSDVTETTSGVTFARRHIQYTAC